jgi:hypothetical protein
MTLARKRAVGNVARMNTAGRQDGGGAGRDTSMCSHAIHRIFRPNLLRARSRESQRATMLPGKRSSSVTVMLSNVARAVWRRTYVAVHSQMASENLGEQRRTH